MIRVFEVANRLLNTSLPAVVNWVETGIGVTDALQTSIALGCPTRASSIVLSVAQWRADFERCASARRGSARFELRDRWVALVHFTSRTEISTHGAVTYVYADASIYADGKRVADLTHRGDLGWVDFLRWLEREAPKSSNDLTA
jgi:hypothetical protein